MLGLVGLKKGMSRVFKDDGNSIPVTVIKIEDSKIVQRKSQEKDGYFAVQVNYGSKKKYFIIDGYIINKVSFFAFNIGINR